MFPCSNRKLRFIFVGRLSKLKTRFSIEGPLLLDAGFECTLEVFGEGEEAENLRQLACQLELDEWVIFHGHLDNPRRSRSS